MTWDLATAKEKLGITGTEQDQDVQDAMDITISLAEGYCDRLFLYVENDKFEDYSVRHKVIYLPRYPINEVKTTNPSPLALVSHFDKLNGRILLDAKTYYETLTITYSAGYPVDALPPDLETAFWDILRIVWNQQYQASGPTIQLGAIKKKTIVGVGAIEYETGSVDNSGTVYITDSSESILDRYERHSA